MNKHKITAKIMTHFFLTHDFLQINLDTLITQQRDAVRKQMLKDLICQKITQATLVSETMTQFTLKYIYMNTIHSSITLAFYLPNTLYP